MSTSETLAQRTRTHRKSCYTFDSLDLRRGGKLSPVTIGYSTWGKLNEAKDNAVLLPCGLTSSTLAYDEEDPNGHGGWWNIAIGPGRPLDPTRFFIICPNPLGGCDGSTGPSSINPATQQPYHMDFPLITIYDIVETQRRLIEHLGIQRLEMVIGLSFGGQQALEWAVAYPDLMKKAIVMGTTASMHTLGLAWMEVGRQIIKLDPGWQNGNYSLSDEKPLAGMVIAQMLALTTYFSKEMLDERFGREITTPDQTVPSPSGTEDMGERFTVENYIYSVGSTIARRFDANSYLYLSHAVNLYNVSDGYTSLEETLSRIKSRVFFVGSSSDMLAPTIYVRQLAEKAQACGVDARYWEMQTPLGHNAFLVDGEPVREALWSFT